MYYDVRNCHSYRLYKIFGFDCRQCHQPNICNNKKFINKEMLKNGYIFIFLAIINVGYVEYIDLQMIVKVKFFFFFIK